MRLWIDGQCLQTASRDRGIGRYVLGLIGGLSRRPDVTLEISFNAAMPEALVRARTIVSQWIDPARIHAWQGITEGGEAQQGFTTRRHASEVALAHHVACLAPDVALVPSVFEGMADPATPLNPSHVEGVPLACIIYDFIPRHYPSRFLQTAEMRLAYERRCDVVKHFTTALAISEFTRVDLLASGYRGASFNIAAGLDQKVVELAGQTRAPREEQTGSYLLYVGGLDWHKNVAVIADAMPLLAAEQREHIRLKVVGSEWEPHQALLRQHAQAAGLPDNFLQFEGHVSDKRLVELYRDALALVQPSFIEGFGLTALEALFCGTPVVCSTAGALTEVVGDAGLTFDPSSPVELAQTLTRLLSEPGLADSLREKGRERAQLFTWDQSADIAARALASSLGSRSTAGASIPDRGALRTRAHAAILPLEIPTDDKISLMASAEPPVPAAPKLVVDASVTLITEARTGIQRVVKSISSELARSGQDEAAKIAFCDDATGWYEVKVADDFYDTKLVKSRTRRLHIGTGDVLLLLDSSWLYHPMHGLTAKRARNRGAKIVSCLYDLVPLNAYAFCHSGMPPAYSAWFAASLTYSDAYVCISRAVADELFDLLEGIKFPRQVDIAYWHLGADIGAAAAGAAPSSPKGQMSRFLMVGTLEPRKGYDVALAAFDKLWNDGRDVELVIVAKPGWNVEHLAQSIREHPEFGKRLRWLQGVSDSELTGLYASCSALVTSSYAEGFGLPIVEARHHGKPVIASDLPVFREVAGVAQSFFFPVGSSAGLAEAVTDFITRPPAPVMDRDRDRNWLTWQESAMELKRVVKEGRWYKTYVPERASDHPMPSAFETVRIQGPLEPADQKFELELVTVPQPGLKLDGARLVVKLTNRSSKVWSSHGTLDGRYGINVAYGYCRAAESSDHAKAARVRIPFALPPGASHYVPINLPAERQWDDSDVLEIELVQEAVAWWGNPLRVPLGVLAGPSA